MKTSKRLKIILKMKTSGISKIVLLTTIILLALTLSVSADNGAAPPGSAQDPTQPYTYQDFKNDFNNPERR